MVVPDAGDDEAGGEGAGGGKGTHALSLGQKTRHTRTRAVTLCASEPSSHTFR